MRTRTSLATLALAATLACRCQPRRTAPPQAPDGGAAQAAPDGGAALDGGLAAPSTPDGGGTAAAAFVEADGDPADLPVRFTCLAAGHELRVGVDGRGSWRGPGGEPRPFALPLVNGGDVALVRCAFLPGGPLLVLGLADERSTWGEIARLGGEPPLRWIAFLPGFPSADPLLAGSHLYVGASGFAGKIDIDAGRWEWSHRGLEDAQFPKQPVLDGGVVLFRDASGAELRADDETGVPVEAHADRGAPGADGGPALPPEAAAARKLVALAAESFPGFSWNPASFLVLDLDGDEEPDSAIAGTGPEMVAVVVARGPVARGSLRWLLVHSTREEEASLRPERLRPPPATLVCPATDEPGARPGTPSPAEANRADCEAYQRRRARLAELDERGARGLVLLPMGVHLFVDPSTGRLAHWRSEP